MNFVQLMYIIRNIIYDTEMHMRKEKGREFIRSSYVFLLILMFVDWYDNWQVKG